MLGYISAGSEQFILTGQENKAMFLVETNINISTANDESIVDIVA